MALFIDYLNKYAISENDVKNATDQQLIEYIKSIPAILKLAQPGDWCILIYLQHCKIIELELKKRNSNSNI